MALALTLAPALTFGHEAESHIYLQQDKGTEELTSQAYLGWDSKYLSEGRDALDGNSLIHGGAELSYQNFAAGIWYGNSPDVNYDELQLSLEASHTLGDATLYLGYTHFRFPFANEHDNEINAGLIWNGLPYEIETYVEAYYSFYADGTFIELGADKEFSLTEKISILTAAQLGINQGYISDGHDGANHIALMLAINYQVTERCSIIPHLTQSWSINRNQQLEGDQQLIDFLHGGITLSYSF